MRQHHVQAHPIPYAVARGVGKCIKIGCWQKKIKLHARASAYLHTLSISRIMVGAPAPGALPRSYATVMNIETVLFDSASPH